ncbi:Espin protein [Spatholobus suberectus]|nr:Espin protein [Spatholobus suberectus]
MYKETLEWVGEPHIKRVLRLQNDMGNTPLHEVALTGELEMTKSIMRYEEANSLDDYYEPLIKMRNHLGETPVYMAAAHGKTDLLRFFLQELGLDVDCKMHFHRSEDKMSILHSAVIGQFFGTALWILTRYDYLAYEKEDNDMTTLQLLAKMPSTFKSHAQMGPFKNFIYLLLPDLQDYKYYHQNKEYTTKKEDLESGGSDSSEPSSTQTKLEDNTREDQNLKSHGKGKSEAPPTQKKLSGGGEGGSFEWEMRDFNG